MIGSEKAFRRYVAQGLKPYGHIVQVENATSIGHPDTSYCIDGHEGHIELKYIREFPKRKNTIIKIPHYTTGQRIWMYKRVRAGGNSFLYVQVAHDYFLFTPFTAYERVGKSLNRKGFEDYCYMYSTGKIDFDCLQFVLSNWEKYKDVDLNNIRNNCSNKITFDMGDSEDDGQKDENTQA